MSNFVLKAFEPAEFWKQFEIRFEIVERTESNLVVTYETNGPVEKLKIPVGRNEANRRSGLWDETCFELFIGKFGQKNYEEWNFSPSFDWEHFEFESYRNRRAGTSEAVPPKIQFKQSQNSMLLRVELNAVQLTGSEEFSATAVLRSKKNEHSYWAIEHAQTKPDFHLRSTFKIKFPVKNSV